MGESDTRASATRQARFDRQGPKGGAGIGQRGEASTSGTEISVEKSVVSWQASDVSYQSLRYLSC